MAKGRRSLTRQKDDWLGLPPPKKHREQVIYCNGKNHACKNPVTEDSVTGKCKKCRRSSPVHSGLGLHKLAEYGIIRAEDFAASQGITLEGYDLAGYSGPL